MVIQERAVVGTQRTPRIYLMKDGAQLEVVWCGQDREFNVPEMGVAMNFQAEMRTQYRWSRAGR